MNNSTVQAMLGEMTTCSGVGTSVAKPLVRPIARPLQRTQVRKKRPLSVAERILGKHEEPDEDSNSIIPDDARELQGTGNTELDRNLAQNGQLQQVGMSTAAGGRFSPDELSTLADLVVQRLSPQISALVNSQSPSLSAGVPLNTVPPPAPAPQTTVVVEPVEIPAPAAEPARPASTPPPPTASTVGKVDPVAAWLIGKSAGQRMAHSHMEAMSRAHGQTEQPPMILEAAPALGVPGIPSIAEAAQSSQITNGVPAPMKILESGDSLLAQGAPMPTPEMPQPGKVFAAFLRYGPSPSR